MRRATPWFDLPERFHLHRGHAWALPIGNRLVKIGMDDFAHRLIGEPTGFGLPGPGDRLRQGELGWKVRINGDAVDLLSPVDGEVVEVNEQALHSPASAGEDPYGTGWLMKVRVPDEETTVRNLLPARLAKTWIEESSSELSSMIGEEIGPVLQDGGVPVRGLAKAIAGDKWPEVAAKLLLTAGPEIC